MYENHVNCIKSSSKLFNIFVALGVVIGTILLSEIISLILLISVPPTNKIFTFVEIEYPYIHSNITSVSGSITMIISIVIVITFAKLSSNMKPKNLGIIKENAFKNYVVSYLLGIILISVIFFIILFTNSITVTSEFNSKNFIFIILAFLFFIFQGAYEEILIRGYLMPHLSKALGNSFSVIFSSLFFSLLHSLNDNISKIALFNLFIAGILFGLIYILTGNLFVVSAFHSAWNFFQGNIFGSNISGNNPYYSIFKSTPTQENNLLSGGNFGFEASIICLIVQIIIIILLFIIKKGNNNGKFNKTRISN